MVFSSSFRLAYVPHSQCYQPALVPRFTNHFQPSSVILAPHQRGGIIISHVDVLLWIGGSMEIVFGTMMHVYEFPYLWVNSRLMLVTSLQHTDPTTVPTVLNCE